MTLIRLYQDANLVYPDAALFVRGQLPRSLHKDIISKLSEEALKRDIGLGMACLKQFLDGIGKNPDAVLLEGIAADKELLTIVFNRTPSKAKPHLYRSIAERMEHKPRVWEQIIRVYFEYSEVDTNWIVSRYKFHFQVATTRKLRKIINECAKKQISAFPIDVSKREYEHLQLNYIKDGTLDKGLHKARNETLANTIADIVQRLENKKNTQDLILHLFVGTLHLREFAGVPPLQSFLPDSIETELMPVPS